MPTCAADIVLLEVPVDYRGNFTVSHAYEGTVGIGEPTWQHMTPTARQMELCILGTGLIVPGSRVGFTSIRRSGAAIVSETSDGVCVFGAWATDPTYNILMLIESSTCRMVALLYR